MRKKLFEAKEIKDIDITLVINDVNKSCNDLIRDGFIKVTDEYSMITIKSLSKNIVLNGISSGSSRDYVNMEFVNFNVTINRPIKENKWTLSFKKCWVENNNLVASADDALRFVGCTFYKSNKVINESGPILFFNNNSQQNLRDLSIKSKKEISFIDYGNLTNVICDSSQMVQFETKDEEQYIRVYDCVFISPKVDSQYSNNDFNNSQFSDNTSIVTHQNNFARIWYKNVTAKNALLCDPLPRCYIDGTNLNFSVSVHKDGMVLFNYGDKPYNCKSTASQFVTIFVKNLNGTSKKTFEYCKVGIKARDTDEFLNVIKNNTFINCNVVLDLIDSDMSDSEVIEQIQTDARISHLKGKHNKLWYTRDLNQTFFNGEDLSSIDF